MKDLTHGELVRLAEAAGFRFPVRSVASADDPSGASEYAGIEHPLYTGRAKKQRLAIASEIFRRGTRGLPEWLILRHLAGQPVNCDRYTGR